MRDRLFDSAETEPERRLLTGSLVEVEGDCGEEASLGDVVEEGDKTGGVLLLDTGDQVSGKEGLEVVCVTVLGSAGAWNSAGGGDLMLLLLLDEVEVVVGDVRRGVRGDAMLSLALKASLCFVPRGCVCRHLTLIYTQVDFATAFLRCACQFFPSFRLLLHFSPLHVFCFLPVGQDPVTLVSPACMASPTPG